MSGNFGTSSLDTEAFEKHATKLLREILFGRQRTAAITSKETQLMANKIVLKRINEEIEPSLVQLIGEMETFVYPSDLALFLIAAKRTDMAKGTELMKQAQEIIDSVIQERRLMSLNDLLSALSSTSQMPGSWAASLFGEMDAERDATLPVEVTKASIELAASPAHDPSGQGI